MKWRIGMTCALCSLLLAVSASVAHAETSITGGENVFYIDKGAVRIRGTWVSGYDAEGKSTRGDVADGCVIRQVNPDTVATNAISVENASVRVILDGVNIDLSAHAASREDSSFSIAQESTVDLFIEEGSVNYLTGNMNAGICVKTDTTLVIGGGGTLFAYGSGRGNAGIGGGAYEGTTGDITINDGIIHARAPGGYAAGIGAGEGIIGLPSKGTVTINGGEIFAQGDNCGPGIGSCFDGGITLVAIHGGLVVATGGSSGAGIGKGFSQSDDMNQGRIVIDGGTVIATGGSNGAGIGGSLAASSLDPRGNWVEQVEISGGHVTARGGSRAPGIGSGVGRGGTTQNGMSIVISGGTVDALCGREAPWDIGNAAEDVTPANDEHYIRIVGGCVKTGEHGIYPVPRDGNGIEGSEVHLTRVHLLGESVSSSLNGQSSIIDSSYGLNDVSTIDGYLYLYLPQSSDTQAAFRNVVGYHGAIGADEDNWLKLDGPALSLFARGVEVTGTSLEEDIGVQMPIHASGGYPDVPVVYESSDTSVAHITDSTLEALRGGSTTISAHQVSASDTYHDSFASFLLEIPFPPLLGMLELAGVAEVGRTLSAFVSGLPADAVPEFVWKRVSGEDAITELARGTSSYRITEEDLGSTIQVEVFDKGEYYAGAFSAKSEIVLAPVIDIAVPVNMSVGIAGSGEMNASGGFLENYSFVDVRLSEVVLSYDLGPQGIQSVLDNPEALSWQLVLGGDAVYDFESNLLTHAIEAPDGSLAASQDGLVPSRLALDWGLSFAPDTRLMYRSGAVHAATITYTVVVAE